MATIDKNSFLRDIRGQIGDQIEVRLVNGQPVVANKSRTLCMIISQK
jgi:hypothetical protein